ncbi:hypothetical protein C8C83_0167 [Flavobacterium sp. 90]|nr:hypothetical protein C8C82_0460 [Flavobacterium sp. 81]TCK52374.1 hypothetical protein C8C83_0167 [Flavobacterium sp. 90]
MKGFFVSAKIEMSTEIERFMFPTINSLVDYNLR